MTAAAATGQDLPVRAGRSARIWLSLFAAGFAVLVALLFVTLFTPPPYPYGALTRIGRVSEEAMGWRVLPPPIAMDVLRASPIDKADILVIGDSFSMYYAFQSPLVAVGYRVATAHWDKVGPLCGAQLAAWLQGQGFRGRWVLIESIERLLPERIADMRRCKGTMDKPFVPIPPPAQSPSQPPPGFAINWNVPLLTGYYTWHNTRAVERTQRALVLDHAEQGDAIFAAPVADGCAQFSHRLCDKGLFLTADRSNPELVAADADFLHAFAQQAQPYQVSWMVIPNKTTVYLDTDHAKDFARRANELRLGPDLFAAAQTGRRRVVDLYWPNDTHWSMQGQLHFGALLVPLARAAIGEPPPPGRAP